VADQDFRLHLADPPGQRVDGRERLGGFEEQDRARTGREVAERRVGTGQRPDTPLWRIAREIEAAADSTSNGGRQTSPGPASG
jgi:hypothetical protein